MATAIRPDRTGQVLVQVCINRAGNVSLSIGLATSLRGHEVETAIDDAQTPVPETGRQFGRARQQALSFRNAHLSIPKMP